MEDMRKEGSERRIKIVDYPSKVSLFRLGKTIARIENVAFVRLRERKRLQLAGRVTRVQDGANLWRVRSTA